jgi:diacylglycerol kinase (ATP)
MIRFLVNPSAGGGKGARSLVRIQQLAAAAGVDVWLSRDAEDLTRLARRAVAEGAERLVVAGGDGTFHHVEQGLAGTDCALGLVPLGRGNDLARTLQIPAGLDDAVEFALEGPIHSIDLGRVSGVCFAGYCGVGFDSEVAGYVHSGSRILKGPLAYTFGVIRNVLFFRSPTVRVEHDEGIIAGSVLFVSIVNCRRFGGGMIIAPDASMTDGLLDLVVVDDISRLELLRLFPKVYSGGHTGHPAVRILRTQKVHISVDRPMRMFSDGEPMLEVDQQGTTVEVWPSALRVVGRQG